ncbi:winged helix-turn-helix transcriptional regulator [Aliagarivorans marinus]|uniref:winged helix-turn-helix transcriptional regulator n=1 Tax=Aliagarivorans marinus TaxID=561965 RepID=UPI00054E6146|nr:helix-turn-helix domain-containing protein [Aliagarivorans marinus]
MTRVNFSQFNCSVAQCLAQVGDNWSFLIIRDAMAGVRRFSDFERSMGIAKNILRNRLSQLVESGILEKIEVGQHGSRQEYQLTNKGRDLFPVLVALWQWSENWVPSAQRSPYQFFNQQTGSPLAKVSASDQDGDEIGLHNIGRRPRTSD